MHHIKSTEKQMKVAIKVMLVAIVFFGVLATTSCQPEGCWDCTNYLINGEYSEVCEQVDDIYCE